MNEHEALNRMQDIMEELRQLSEEAEGLCKEHFPSEMPSAEAYGVFDFGSSGNPYDTTYEKLIEGIENDLDPEEDEED